MNKKFLNIIRWSSLTLAMIIFILDLYMTLSNNRIPKVQNLSIIGWIALSIYLLLSKEITNNKPLMSSDKKVNKLNTIKLYSFIITIFSLILLQIIMTFSNYQYITNNILNKIFISIQIIMVISALVTIFCVVQLKKIKNKTI